MKTKHTAAPWKIGRRGAARTISIIGRDDTGRPVTIAEDVRTEADACLFATAPDLLAALKQAETDQMAYVDRLYHAGPRMSESLAAARARLEATRAAITKATAAD